MYCFQFPVPPRVSTAIGAHVAPSAEPSTVSGATGWSGQYQAVTSAPLMSSKLQVRLAGSVLSRFTRETSPPNCAGEPESIARLPVRADTFEKSSSGSARATASAALVTVARSRVALPLQERRTASPSRPTARRAPPSTVVAAGVQVVPSVLVETVAAEGSERRNSAAVTPSRCQVMLAAPVAATTPPAGVGSSRAFSCAELRVQVCSGSTSTVPASGAVTGSEAGPGRSPSPTATTR